MAVPLSTAFAHGAAADRPTASATIEGQFYFSEDTGDFSQVQGGAWVTVAAAGGGGSVLLTAEALLTDADLKAFGTGTHFVDVVAAPGAGNTIIFDHGIVTVDATAGVYGGIPADATLSFKYHGGSNASSPLREANGGVSVLLGSDGERTAALFGSPYGVDGGTVNAQVYDASEIENYPLALYCDNSTGLAFTGGNAANSGRIKVWYSIESLP